MDDNQLLDLCLKITGHFEGGTPSYSLLTGDFDGQGMSGGILQWNAGQGTLQRLAGDIGEAMGWEKAATFFTSDIRGFSETTAVGGVLFAHAHYLDPQSPRHLLPAAEASWKAFLSSPEGVQAQRSLAESTILAHAKREAALYLPQHATSTRVIAFFFDLCTQQGSMGKIPVSDNPDPQSCLLYAASQDIACTAMWHEVATTDALAATLLYYAYERARLAKAIYVWPSLSRRGTIACRKGIAERTHFDFTSQLD